MAPSALATWWQSQQQAALFGAQSLAETVTVWTGESDPDTAAGTSTSATVHHGGEAMDPVDGMDASQRIGRATLNRAEVTLTRAAAGRYGYLDQEDGTRWAIVRVLSQSDAVYVVELSRITIDRTAPPRGRPQR